MFNYKLGRVFHINSQQLRLGSRPILSRELTQKLLLLSLNSRLINLGLQRISFRCNLSQLSSHLVLLSSNLGLLSLDLYNLLAKLFLNFLTLSSSHFRSSTLSPKTDQFIHINSHFTCHFFNLRIIKTFNINATCPYRTRRIHNNS